MEDDVVLGPAEPARFDVEADLPAVADELLGDDPAIINFKGRTDDKGDIKMAPGLRDVPSRGEVWRARLGRIAGQHRGRCRTCGSGDRYRTVTDAAERAGEAGSGRQVIRSNVGRDGSCRCVQCGLGCLSRHRYGAQKAPGFQRLSIADLRDAHASRLADVAAEIDRLAVGVRIGEVRVRLAGEESAPGALGVAQARDKAVGEVGYAS